MVHYKLNAANLMCEFELFELAGSGTKETYALFTGGARWSKAQKLLNVLANGHGAQNVEEDEGAVRVVIAGKIPVAQTLDPGDGRKGQLGNDTAVEDAIEHAKQGGEGETRGKHRLHLD